MAEEQHTTAETGEIKDRGLFDFLGKKKEEKPQEEVIATELEKVHVSEPEEKNEEEEEKKPSLHRSGSSSSSSSSDEEEVEEGGEKIKKKKKKGLKEKIEGKISGEKEEEKKAEYEDTSIPIEKYDEVPVVVSHHEEEVKTPEEKKSFMDKIKDKLPGTNKKTEEFSAPAAPVPTPAPVEHEGEAKEKKGILEKIKEKFPGYHKTEEEKKETDH